MLLWVIMLCKRPPEKHRNSRKIFMTSTAKIPAHGWHTSRRHLHSPSRWSGTARMPEEAGEMQLLDECSSACVIDKQNSPSCHPPPATETSLKF